MELFAPAMAIASRARSRPGCGEAGLGHPTPLGPQPGAPPPSRPPDAPHSGAERFRIVIQITTLPRACSYIRGHAASYHPEVYIPRVARDGRDLRAHRHPRCAARG
jgi:hypothetical protein